jgi:hypothetical protein
MKPYWWTIRLFRLSPIKKLTTFRENSSSQAETEDENSPKFYFVCRLGFKKWFDEAKPSVSSKILNISGPKNFKFNFKKNWNVLIWHQILYFTLFFWWKIKFQNNSFWNCSVFKMIVSSIFSDKFYCKTKLDKIL